MSTTTSNLGLFKYNVETDSHLAFNINTALNQNWDIIDNFARSQIVPIATTQTAGIVKPDGETITITQDGTISADLSGKADIDLSNCTKPYITETYINGSSWYRVYSDGWCEQGSLRSAGATGTTETINLLKPYKDTNYNVLKTFSLNYGATYYQFTSVWDRTKTSFKTGNTSGIQDWSWYACGYIN